MLLKCENNFEREHTVCLFKTTNSVFADMKMHLGRGPLGHTIVRGAENGAGLTEVKRPMTRDIFP